MPLDPKEAPTTLSSEAAQVEEVTKDPLAAISQEVAHEEITYPAVSQEEIEMLTAMVVTC